MYQDYRKQTNDKFLKRLPSSSAAKLSYEIIVKNFFIFLCFFRRVALHFSPICQRTYIEVASIQLNATWDACSNC